MLRTASAVAAELRRQQHMIRTLEERNSGLLQDMLRHKHSHLQDFEQSPFMLRQESGVLDPLQSRFRLAECNQGSVSPICLTPMDESHGVQKSLHRETENACSESGNENVEC